MSETPPRADQRKVIRVRDFVSGAKAKLSGADTPPRVGALITLRDDQGRECTAMVRSVARVPHNPRGSHWEMDVEPRLDESATGHTVEALAEIFGGLTSDERQLLTCALAGNFPPPLSGLRPNMIKGLAMADTEAKDV